MVGHVYPSCGHDVVVDATTFYCVTTFVWTSTKTSVLTQKDCHDH